jgi:hypothetical protein
VIHDAEAVSPMQSLHGMEELRGPGELRNLGGVLVFVPEVVEAKALQAAVNYLLLQINVRNGMDSGGT